MPCSASQVSTERVRIRLTSGSSRSRFGDLLGEQGCRHRSWSCPEQGDRLGGDPAVHPGLQYERVPAHRARSPRSRCREPSRSPSSRTISSWGHIDQAPGQVAGVGGPKGGVGQPLAGTVGRDEVLEDRETLAERGLDRPGGSSRPRGLETSPFMPAIWRICWLFPRAPESTIMSSGLKAMVDSDFSIAFPTSELAEVQSRSPSGDARRR